MKRPTRWHLVTLILTVVAGLGLASASALQAFAAQRVLVNDSNFSQLKQQSDQKPVLFVVSTSWCQYCKVLEPMLQAAAQKDSGNTWTWAYVDGDTQKGVQGQLGVSGYPTMIAYAHGKEMSTPARSAGLPGNSQSAIDAWIQQMVQGFGPAPQPKPTPKPPTNKPTSDPTNGPDPDVVPTYIPTDGPTPNPTTDPTETPTDGPTIDPPGPDPNPPGPGPCPPRPDPPGPGPDPGPPGPGPDPGPPGPGPDPGPPGPGPGPDGDWIQSLINAIVKVVEMILSIFTK